MANKNHDPVQKMLDSLGEYDRAKRELNENVHGGLNALGKLCLFCIPMYIWIQLVTSVSLFFFVGLPLIYDIVYYSIQKKHPQKRLDDDTKDTSFFFMWRAPVSSYVAWIATILLFIYAASQLKDRTAEYLGILFCIIAILYKIGIRRIMKGEINEQDRKQNRIDNFVNANKDKTNGKYKYVYCVGPINILKGIRDHQFSDWRCSFAIYRVPKDLQKMAKFGNVAIGKRFFDSTSDSRMIIGHVFSADEKHPDIPKLTWIDPPAQKWVSKSYEPHKEYDLKELQPCAIIIKNEFGQSIGQTNKGNGSVDIGWDWTLGDYSDWCLVPNDIPIDTLSYDTFVIIETKDGKDVLGRVNGYLTKDRKNFDNWDFPTGPATDVLEGFINAMTTDDEHERELFFRLHTILHTSYGHPFSYVKALIEY